jgi:hypothetical protein
VRITFVIKTLSWTIFFVLSGIYCYADVFIVTSNADSGPGTLRDAIIQSVANGVIVRDSIIFNLADNSVAGRTITLLSPLPVLASNTAVNV